MSDYIWETLDGLFKTVHQQNQHLRLLEMRIVELERSQREVPSAPMQRPLSQRELQDVCAERAA